MQKSCCAAEFDCGLDAMGLRKRVSAAPAPMPSHVDQDSEPENETTARKDTKPKDDVPVKVKCCI